MAGPSIGTGETDAGVDGYLTVLSLEGRKGGGREGKRERGVKQRRDSGGMLADLTK